MGKGACIKRMVAVRNYSANIIMEKTNRVKDMEFSAEKVKNLKIFLEQPIQC